MRIRFTILIYLLSAAASCNNPPPQQEKDNAEAVPQQDVSFAVGTNHVDCPDGSDEPTCSASLTRPMWRATAGTLSLSAPTNLPSLPPMCADEGLPYDHWLQIRQLKLSLNGSARSHWDVCVDDECFSSSVTTGPIARGVGASQTVLDDANWSTPEGWRLRITNAEASTLKALIAQNVTLGNISPTPRDGLASWSFSFQSFRKLVDKLRTLRDGNCPKYVCGYQQTDIYTISWPGGELNIDIHPTEKVVLAGEWITIPTQTQAGIDVSTFAPSCGWDERFRAHLVPAPPYPNEFKPFIWSGLGVSGPQKIVQLSGGWTGAGPGAAQRWRSECGLGSTLQQYINAKAVTNLHFCTE